MARDIKLDSLAYDSTITFNDLEIIDDEQEVNQNIVIRLQTLLGEWFDDTRLGLGWLGDMTDALVPPIIKRHLIREVIRKTYGVKVVNSVIMSVSNDGVASVSFEVTLNDGATFDNTVEIDELLRIST